MFLNVHGMKIIKATLLWTSTATNVTYRITKASRGGGLFQKMAGTYRFGILSQMHRSDISCTRIHHHSDSSRVTFVLIFSLSPDADSGGLDDGSLV
ncbi:hypothetical protein EVAR_15660_1 [Eumeta japonica]|uniref:Uncharacterized protein n=1 Tax=Eumeta variegata TaxID=151549 RepID=A0A4C1UAR2_EUMVA|nr:hypothetical protein EVAR_15660_1 [Eumeta japonica]